MSLLCVGVLAIFGAILLTFLSRQLQEQEPDLTILEAEASLREKKLSHRSRHSGGALSFGSLSGLLHKVGALCRPTTTTVNYTPLPSLPACTFDILCVYAFNASTPFSRVYFPCIYSMT